MSAACLHMNSRELNISIIDYGVIHKGEFELLTTPSLGACAILVNAWNITKVDASIDYVLDMPVDVTKNDISLISSMPQLTRHKNGLQRSFTSSRNWTELL
ncbi:alpha,alpha-trehalose-phosphate synthase [UDP-forming] [Trifolium repens]|nr:alpha,alpha-trehalose-phosphate synthase [UDP-forming] [Trifolium repens]KAK2455105.1 alpha,alpha-trehalose-phosphate synthase [UDP-forming] [Trifolium repens]